MSSDQNMPEVQMHQGPPPQPAQMGQDGDSAQDSTHNIPHGMGQSKSSRRRRRKRKNKGMDAAPGAKQGGEQASGQLAGDIQGNSQPQSFAPPPQQNNGGGQQNGAGAGTKRWKKKFRERDRQRSPENPGNIAASASSNGGGGYRDANSHQPGNGGGGFKRKGKQQRGPRSFVGPMDHSYRATNGNFAETPPSTMDSHSNGNYQGRGNGGGRSYVSDSQPIDYSVGRPIPIPENAPTRILFFIEDLFFNAKITETAQTRREGGLREE